MLPKDILKQELQRRMDKNPRYTMRAFARSLGINVGTLSSLLNGKRRFTHRSAQELLIKANISPKQMDQILSHLNSKQNSPKSKKNVTDIESRIEIEEEVFSLISNWYHYAIMQLIRTDEYLSKPIPQISKWIARKIQISEAEASLAVDRLLSLNMIGKDNKSKLVRTKKRFTTANKNLTSIALRNLQKEIREKAIESIENHPIEVRSMSSITMAIDPSKIEEARKMIDEFQEKLATYLEKDKKTSVYQLCVSLFPLQTLEN